MPRVQKSSSPLKLPGGGLRAPCRSFSLHLLVGPCHSEEKWIRHGCLSNRAHLFSLSLSLSLSARALVARELRFVLPDPDSRSPKLKFKPCRRQKGKAGRWRGAGACGGLGRSRTYHSPLQTSSSSSWGTTGLNYPPTGAHATLDNNARGRVHTLCLRRLKKSKQQTQNSLI